MSGVVQFKPRDNEPQSHLGALIDLYLRRATEGRAEKKQNRSSKRYYCDGRIEAKLMEMLKRRACSHCQ